MTDIKMVLSMDNMAPGYASLFLNDKEVCYGQIEAITALFEELRQQPIKALSLLNIYHSCCGGPENGASYE